MPNKIWFWVMLTLLCGMMINESERIENSYKIKALEYDVAWIQKAAKHNAENYARYLTKNQLDFWTHKHYYNGTPIGCDFREAGFETSVNLAIEAAQRVDLRTGKKDEKITCNLENICYNFLEVK